MYPQGWYVRKIIRSEVSLYPYTDTNTMQLCKDITMCGIKVLLGIHLSWFQIERNW